MKHCIFPEQFEVEKGRYWERPWSAARWEIPYRYLHIASGTMVVRRLPEEPSLTEKRLCPWGQHCNVSISRESACRLRDSLVIQVNGKVFKGLMESALQLVISHSHWCASLALYVPVLRVRSGPQQLILQQSPRFNVRHLGERKKYISTLFAATVDHRIIRFFFYSAEKMW